jgi:hypothetical protein
VELDLVYAVAVAVVGAQPRLVPVGVVGPLLRLGAAGQLAEPVQVTDRPGGTFPGDRGEQRGVGRDVVAGQRGSLVENLVGHPADITPG